MKVILFMAMSVNGIIAAEDYSEDFLNGTWKYLVELGHRSGYVIWGRKTYELVNKMPKKYMDSIAGIQKIVISSNTRLPLAKDSRVFKTPGEALSALEKLGCRSVLLSGGSGTNSSFAALGLIDEVVLIVDSVIMGAGIPLFAKNDFKLKLDLLQAQPKDGHLVYLRYRVIK